MKTLRNMRDWKQCVEVYTMTKNIDYFMGLKYKISVTQIDESDGGGLLLEIPELGKLSTCA